MTANNKRLEHAEFAVQFLQSESVHLVSKIYFTLRDLKQYAIEVGVPVALVSLDVQQSVLVCGIAWQSSKLKHANVAVSAIWMSDRLNIYQIVRIIKISNCSANLQIDTAARLGLHLDIPLRRAQKIDKRTKNVTEKYLQTMLQDMIVFPGAVFKPLLYGTRIMCQVVAAKGRSNRNEAESQASESLRVFKVDFATNVYLEPLDTHNLTEKSKSDAPRTINYASIGGLHEQIMAIQAAIELPLFHPNLFLEHKLAPLRGVLLHGPSGTGKTLLANAVGCEINAEFFTLQTRELVTDLPAKCNAKIEKVFKSAVQNAPSIVCIDDIDLLCSVRKSHSRIADNSICVSLTSAMEGISSPTKHSRVVVLATTNRLDAVDCALRRPGLFDREIEIPVPNAESRLEILTILLRSIHHSLSRSEMEDLMKQAHGFVGSDLVAVCKQATLAAYRRACTPSEIDAAAPWWNNTSFSMQDFMVTFQNMKSALLGIQPSALREIVIDVPKVYWHEIGGQDSIKQQLKEVIEWPLLHPEAFERLGIRPPRGVLLYGPPGCSKTMIAKALATESSMNFLAVKGPELFSKWVGESEKAIQSLFKKARAATPSLIFFDEIDAIATQRSSQESGSQVTSRVISQLLTELDGIEQLRQVVIVAATNRPDLIDKALMRPGRIDRILYVGPPDNKARLSILDMHAKRMPVHADVDLQELVSLTENYSGAEVASLCREAAMLAVTENIHAKTVMQKHFLQALEKIQPQIDEEMLQFFASFRDR